MSPVLYLWYTSLNSNGTTFVELTSSPVESVTGPTAASR